MKALENQALNSLNFIAHQIEIYFKCPIFSYTGSIQPVFIPEFINHFENLKLNYKNIELDHPKRIVIILSTPGGSAETVEKMAEIIRHDFEEVYFVVHIQAMSAGTIFCMSGDKIYMDYTSSLGPIDPQVPSASGHYVPALGYVDKVNELIEISKTRSLSDAEYSMLKNIDLAQLKIYEQARDLSISLLKKWLVEFKFKDWTTHRTSNQGEVVTLDQKIERAERIAKVLSDNNRWLSHGRYIGIETLQKELRLEIEDYTNIVDLRYNLSRYAELCIEYRNGFTQSECFMHSVPAYYNRNLI